MRRLHTCFLCEACCGLVLEVESDRVRSVRGDPDDPSSRGHICPKAAAIEDIRTDPDRVTVPLRKTRSGFAEISWEEALDEVTDRVSEIQRVHGREAFAMYLGNPMAHSYAGLLGALSLWYALGTRSRFSATSADQLPHMLAALEMLGHQALLPVPDIDRTRHMLVIGANPAVSNGSLMTAPGVASRLEAIVQRGGKVVVIDPRRTETAKLASEHHFIVPGTDALLLMAMIRTIMGEGLAKLGHVEGLVDGARDLERAAKPFSPERVAQATGIDPGTIVRLAREFAKSDCAVCYTRVGACTQEFGGLTAWLGLALTIVTGNFDREGGAMFASPAVDLVKLASTIGQTGSFGRYESRVRGLPEFGGELPVATLADEIETPGKGQIRGLVTIAGNPVLSTPNGARLERLLPKLDFMVSVDIYRNETTRHAHILLPTTFGTERAHYDLVLYALAVRNAARYAPAIFAPAGSTRDDWDILTDLAVRLLERDASLRARASRRVLQAMRAVGPERMLDGLLRAGPHRLSLRKLREQPSGIDLGPLVRRFPMGRRRIALAPNTFLRDVPRLEARMAAKTNGALALIGRRSLRSNNSWMHNSARLVKGKRECTLLMHPDDAKERGLSDGQDVRVRSRVGEVRVPLQISDEVRRGVVSLPHGWGHARAADGLRVAAAHAGASLNDLTDESNVDALSATAAFKVDVTVEAV
jgi:anaerobic selenocysteine-containing dehydrogenase